MTRSFRERLLQGEMLLGTMVTLPVAATAEIVADAGFDWLFVDGEHGPIGTSELVAILQAVGERVPCLVRVPAATEPAIKSALDAGATGIIVPQVNTADTAAAVVRYARYAPEGGRGVGIARAHGYGFRFDEYMRSANEKTVVIVQAEHASAVEHIDEIVQVPGVDAVFLGPYDLSASLGKIGRFDDPEVRAAMDRITEACTRSGMALGCFGLTAEAASPFVDRGYRLIVAGVDTVMLGAAARELYAALDRGTKRSKSS
jgi:2-dehydro-3-deoxyglucarate aldolase